ncbi:MAG: zinc-ribbon domain-containing protein [Zhenhengia sp.]
MKEKLICPDCHNQEVEEVNACGASNYFCNHCKKLISSARVKEVNAHKDHEVE